jgi:hypothetical protein
MIRGRPSGQGDRSRAPRRRGTEPAGDRAGAGGKLKLVEQAAKLRPVGLVALRHFAEHLASCMPAQRRDLRRFALAPCRYSRIAVNYGFFLHQTSAPKKPFVFKAPILVH